MNKKVWTLRNTAKRLITLRPKKGGWQKSVKQGAKAKHP